MANKLPFLVNGKRALLLMGNGYTEMLQFGMMGIFLNPNRNDSYTERESFLCTLFSLLPFLCTVKAFSLAGVKFTDF